MRASCHEPNFIGSLLLLAALAIPTFAQTQERPPTFHSNVELVTVPVVQENARNAVVKFLAESFPVSEPVLLAGLDSSGLKVIHDFTTDSTVLIAALRGSHANTQHTTAREEARLAADAEGGSGPDAVEGINIREFLGPEFGHASSAAARRTGSNISVTLQAFQELARALAAIPGRKTLIWASGGIPFDYFGGTAEFAALYQQTWNLLSSSNVAVYPVIAQQEEPAARQYVGQRKDPSAGPTVVWEAGSTSQAVQAFAAYTGGTVCSFRSDLSRCLTNAIQDSAAYYLIGYYAPRRPAPGWRKLAVRVAAQGSHVRARTGYYSLGSEEAPRQGSSDIALAFRSPLDYTGIPIEFRWTGISHTGSESRRRYGFEVHVPPSTVAVDETGSSVSVDIVAVARDGTGKEVATFSQRVSGELSKDVVQQIVKSGMRYTNAFELGVCTYRIRIVVRDNISGLIGTVTAPLQVD